MTTYFVGSRFLAFSRLCRAWIRTEQRRTTRVVLTIQAALRGSTKPAELPRATIFHKRPQDPQPPRDRGIPLCR